MLGNALIEICSPESTSLPMGIKPERCRLVFHKLDRDLEKLAAEQQADTVHRFRTTTRRLQTLLEELIPERTRRQKKLLKALRSIRKPAGKLRDLDVQIEALRSLKVPLEPHRKTQLLQGLIELRATHEKRLRKRLTKQAAREIRKQLKRISREIEIDDSRDPLGAAREVLSRVAVSNGTLTEDALHHCRLLVKRARYTAEFSQESPAVTQFIAHLKRLQDILGNWHDWLALTHTATERLGGVHESPLVAILHNVAGGKLRNAVAAVTSSPALLSRPKTVPTTPRKTTIKTAQARATASAA